MKTQNDRKIVAELERTDEVQRQAQVKRQALERETAVLHLRGEVVRSQQMVRVAPQNALAAAAAAGGERNAVQFRAEGRRPQSYSDRSASVGATRAARRAGR